MKLAVIDLGTNTCNLLVAKIENGNYQLLHQGKVGVKLGKDGIHKNQLTTEAFNRATSALLQHKQTIASLNGVDRVITIATSAVRDAANKKDFCETILSQTGLELSVISGEEEARLIFKGVELAFGNIPSNSLVLDIGGGSNEFILTENNTIKWKESFPLGMARVIENFQLSDPISPNEVIAIEQWFNAGLTNLWSQINGAKISRLIGCSGAFDTLADLIDNTPPGSKNRKTQEISIADFSRIADKIIHSTKTDREQLPAMEPLRVEMIVPAFIFIRLIIKKLGIVRITQTDFALREGVLQEWINH